MQPHDWVTRFLVDESQNERIYSAYHPSLPPDWLPLLSVLFRKRKKWGINNVFLLKLLSLIHTTEVLSVQGSCVSTVKLPLSLNCTQDGDETLIKIASPSKNFIYLTDSVGAYSVLAPSFSHFCVYSAEWRIKLCSLSYVSFHCTHRSPTDPTAIASRRSTDMPRSYSTAN